VSVPAVPVICLTGPTAVGKTALAVRLVQRLPLEIVSVDSAMVYRGMDVGTGKPGPRVLARAPHRLIDIRDPEQTYSAGEFRADALAAIEAIVAAGRVPLLVGGTGLYFRALEEGLAALPGRDPERRAALDALARAHGGAALHARLAAVDPSAARRIHANDPQRLQRALEVYEITGRPMSELVAEGRAVAPDGRPGRRPDRPLDRPVVRIALLPSDRRDLHRRIATRFERMLARGLVEEVRALARRPGVHAGLPSMRAVGYRQVWEHLEGRGDRARLAARGAAATRQLARRQLTWLRARPGVERFLCDDPRVGDKILKLLASSGVG